ncbi:hypothetical protein TWF106_000663 [Orbilia oligospora]|uniref:F-box domain-containing protein n=1 Tax=Orbilia oligospora TaxID=2813651 RepID=A0A7C8QCU6_ORBOL|nr:hypothetical protein TWF106_000663 [Orbilia oligospora]
MGLTCKSISHIAIPGLYSLCYFDFLLQEETYVISGPIEVTTANYLAYAKHHRAVRHLRINHQTCFRDRNLGVYPSGALGNPRLHNLRAPSKPVPNNPVSIFNKIGPLLPRFTALTTVDLRNHEYTPEAALRQIQTIQMILASCPSLKDLSIQINCDSQVKLLELNTLEAGHHPDQNYPRLTALIIQLTETCYDNNLEPVQNLLNSLCKLLHHSARTVKRLEFGFEVKRLVDDSDCSPWYWPLRGGQSWVRLDLPLVEAACLDMRQGGLSGLMISEYIHFDPTKVKTLRLTNAEKILDLIKEESVLYASKYLAKFTNVEVIEFWPLVDSTWLHGAFAARRSIENLKELRVLIDGLCLLPGSVRFSLLLEVINKYGSQHKAQVLNTTNPCGLFQDVVVVVQF